ncbi:MAG: ATP-grasp domain-containing protein [Chromatiaceae bacterium]|nr:ATP-grasp domain-containing protein [Chromatiaceae bacterium]MCP5313782.1 ATP-grasp domain-containing protein [Chromatiaceae bacterium]
MTPRLLIPSVGGKSDLVRLLGDAVRTRGGQLFGSDLNDAAPALAWLDRRLDLPGFDDPRFWAAVRAAVLEHRITGVVPVRDAELAGWAAQAEAGVLDLRVMTSPAQTLRTCIDKRLLYQAAEAAGIACPAWRVREPDGRLTGLRFPVILKPVFGSGSRDTCVVDRSGDLPVGADGSRTLRLVQEFKSGPEYSVDCFAERDGVLRACFVRERTLVAFGQSIAGTAVDDPELVALCHSMARALPFRGVVNFQFIRDADGAWLIDLNPRFPGGIAITEAAGFPLCEWTVQALAD